MESVIRSTMNSAGCYPCAEQGWAVRYTIPAQKKNSCRDVERQVTLGKT